MPSESARVRMLCLALLIGTLLIFSRAGQCDFVNYDDPDYVTANPHVQHGLTLPEIGWAFTGKSDYWHPLTTLSHQLDWTLWKDNPHGHHATSIVLHAINAMLAFLVLRRLTGALWMSALCAALFALHPLRVESVAWIAERKDLLSGLFFFLSILSYTEYVKRQRTGRPTLLAYGATLAAFTAGLMSKPMVVTLPCVLLLLDYWPLERWREIKPWHLLLEKVPFATLAVLASVVTYHMQIKWGAMVENLPLSWRLGNAVVSIPRYLGKFFYPTDLAVFYPHAGHWPPEVVAAAAGLVLTCCLTAVLFVRKNPAIFVGWFWFLGMLVPVLGIVQVGDQAMADRYTYLPIVGLQIAVLWTLRPLLIRHVAPLAIAGVVALGLTMCAAMTWNQLGVWRNTETLFEHANRVTKDNYVAHYNLGTTFMEKGQVDQAAEHLARAIEINPRFLDAKNNYGAVLALQGHYDQALEVLLSALRDNPNSPDTHGNLGMLYATIDRPDDAISEYRTLLTLRPNDAHAMAYLASALSTKGRYEEAVIYFDQALKLQPVFPEAHLGFGWTLSQLRRRQEAIREANLAIEQRPDYPQARLLLQSLRTGQY